jgi:Tol biopolymer transport system component
VIFQTERQGTLDVFRQRIDSEAAEPLVSGPGDQFGGRVSPDGQWVIFLSRETPESTVQLNRVPVQGGPIEEILESPHYVHFRCGEHGGCVLVEREGNDDVVYDLDLEKGRGRELYRKPAGTVDPAISPDGQTMAYLTGVANHTIRILSRTGQPIRELQVPGDVPLQSLHWSADGRGFFSSFATQGESTLVYVTASGAARKLWSDRNAHLSWAIPSHDGKRLAIFAATQSSDVWTVDGF